MATGRFSMGEAIRFGWAKMADSLGFFIALLIVANYLILIFPGIIISGLTKEFTEFTLVIFLISILISLVLIIIMMMGFVRITLKSADGLKGKFSDLFSCYPLFFKCLFGSILYLAGTLLLIIPGIIWAISFQFYDYFYGYKFSGILNGLIALGLILLSILGIIWAIRFQFWPYFIIDKGAGPIEALKRSLTITKGSTWNLSVFALLLGAINLLGILSFWAGFLTIPITKVAVAFVYRRLQTLTEDAQIPELAQAPEVTQTPEVMTF